MICPARQAFPLLGKRKEGLANSGGRPEIPALTNLPQESDLERGQ